MQYLIQNKVNYSRLSDFSIVIPTWNSNSNIIKTFSTSPFISLNDENITFGMQKYLISFSQQENTQMSNIIYNIALDNEVPSLIILNLFLSFTCSNIMAINNSDSITITVEFKTDNDIITRNYMYPIKQQFMNTYQIFDHCFVPSLKNFKISATSTTPITLLPPVNLTDKQNIDYSYFLIIYD